MSYTIIKKLFLLTALLSCTNVLASNEIISAISVNNGVVIVTASTNRTENVQQCVSPENVNKWAFV